MSGTLCSVVVTPSQAPFERKLSRRLAEHQNFADLALVTPRLLRPLPAASRAPGRRTSLSRRTQHRQTQSIRTTRFQIHS